MTMENEILHANQDLEDEIANGGGEQHEDTEDDSEAGLDQEPGDSDQEEPFGTSFLSRFSTPDLSIFPSTYSRPSRSC